MDLGISVSTLHRWAKEGGFRCADIATERPAAMTLPSHQPEKAQVVDDGEDIEALSEIVFRRLEEIAGEEYILDYYTYYVVERGGIGLFEEVAQKG